MRRWNGWGDESVDYPLSAGSKQFLQARLAQPTPPRDATLQQIIEKIPQSRLSQHQLVTTDPRERLCHARGQSFPDWLSLRAGTVDTFPDGVAHPTCEEQVTELLRFAEQAGAVVIPYGGGTSVVGHINPIASDRPVITLHLDKLSQLQNLDETSQLATFGAGVCGQDLERALAARGFMLGHYPQSFDYATVGGWIATRSSGQESAGYGRIEQLFAGGRVVTPKGLLELPPFAASAAGPDLRQLVLGSEGRLGVITQATMRVQRVPEVQWYQGVFFPDWNHAVEAARTIAQQRIGYTMMRISTAQETETMLALAGHEVLLGALEWALSLRGAADGKCMMMLGFSGTRTTATSARKQVLQIVRHNRGVYVGNVFGKTWVKSRFRSPYLRNSLWDAGYGLDTLETIASWQDVEAVVQDLENALQHALDDEGERIHLFTHLSHIYPTGSSVYCTYVFRLDESADVNLNRWKKLKNAASQVIVKHQASISHQHGVGIDHAPYLKAEKGELGLQSIAETLRWWDPNQMMNPGKLV